jgi:uncharacterized protein (TIGR03435 family)
MVSYFVTVGFAVEGKMFRVICVATLLTVVGQITVAKTRAQTASTEDEFDVASVKPSHDAQARALVQATPGRLTLSNLSLQRLLLIAYDIQDYQLVGEPSWAESSQYDVIATASTGTSVQKMEGPMLQALLQDRFQLKLHRETRALPLYELVVAKSGPKLRPSEKGSCTPYVKGSQPAIAAAGQPQPLYCGFHRTGSSVSPILDGKGVSIADLGNNLARSYNTALGRNIVDKTGLSGVFDIHLTWTNDRGSSDAALPSTSDDVSIFTALEEQLGLKSQSAKGPVDVLVIDHIEQPSPN